MKVGVAQEATEFVSSSKSVQAGEIFSITLLLFLALVIVMPTVLALIFKSETKQAKFEL